jgi:NTP pyrophosphatase (non-canonical NTP hydrolase)
MKIDKEKFLKEVLNKNGIINQLDQLTEELGELIAAINQYKRGRVNATKNLHEEFADVELMMEQIELILSKQLIENIKNKKLKRLYKKMKGN